MLNFDTIVAVLLQAILVTALVLIGVFDALVVSLGGRGGLDRHRV